VDTLAASKALRRLRDAGLFTSDSDRGSATWYQPTARMLGRDDLDGVKDGAGAAQVADELAAQGAGGAGLSSNPLSLSSNLSALSSNLGPEDSNPRQPEPHDDPLADPRRQALLNELPGSLAA
jgi:ATP-dependent DNA helicase RecG